MPTQKIKIEIEATLDHDRNFVSAHAAVALPAVRTEIDVFRAVQTNDINNCFRAVLYRLSALLANRVAKGDEPPRSDLKRMFDEMPDLEISDLEFPNEH